MQHYSKIVNKELNVVSIIETRKQRKNGKTHVYAQFCLRYVNMRISVARNKMHNNGKGLSRKFDCRGVSVELSNSKEASS